MAVTVASGPDVWTQAALSRSFGGRILRTGDAHSVALAVTPGLFGQASRTVVAVEPGTDPRTLEEMLSIAAKSGSDTLFLTDKAPAKRSLPEGATVVSCPLPTGRDAMGWVRKLAKTMDVAVQGEDLVLLAASAAHDPGGVASALRKATICGVGAGTSLRALLDAPAHADKTGWAALDCALAGDLQGLAGLGSATVPAAAYVEQALRRAWLLPEETSTSSEAAATLGIPDFQARTPLTLLLKLGHARCGLLMRQAVEASIAAKRGDDMPLLKVLLEVATVAGGRGQGLRGNSVV